MLFPLHGKLISECNEHSFKNSHCVLPSVDCSPQREGHCHYVLPACCWLQELLDFLGFAAMLTMNGDKCRTRLRRRLITGYLTGAEERIFTQRCQDYGWKLITQKSVDFFLIFSSNHYSYLQCCTTLHFTTKGLLLTWKLNIF